MPTTRWGNGAVGCQWALFVALAVVIGGAQRAVPPPAGGGVRGEGSASAPVAEAPGSRRQSERTAEAAPPVGADVDVVTRPAEVLEQPVPKMPVTGPRFRQVLDTPVVGLTWRNVTVRDVTRQIAEAYGVAINRDRRLDPTVTVDLAESSVPLRQVIEDAARATGGEVRVVGNVVYFGPTESAAVVRTLVELRRQELDGFKDRRLAARKVAVQRGQTVRWGDLTEPAEILRLVAERFGLRIENPDLIPYDLWAGAALPEMTAAESLTLVLVQWDLTFAWGGELTSVRLMPLPADRSAIVVERRYPLTSSAGETVARWTEKVPGIKAEVAGREIVVRGTVEQQEAVEQQRTGRGLETSRPGSGEPAVVPLARRKFSLAVSRVPVKAVMAKLEESGIRFEYDARRLADAGVDLDTPVSLDLKQADADGLLKALFGPTGTAFEVQGATVRLRPAK